MVSFAGKGLLTEKGFWKGLLTLMEAIAFVTLPPSFVVFRKKLTCQISRPCSKVFAIILI